MRQISYKTLGEQLEHVLRERRVYQLFVLELGPDDAVYLSALAVAHDEKVVEAKAAAPSFAQAFAQLLLNIQQATEEP